MTKEKTLKNVFIYFLTFTLVFSSFAAIATAETSTTMKVRIVETTDIHTHIMNYDYYKDSATDAFGLARAAGLIKQARAEVKNSLLFDNGDLIQGNPMGDYVAKIKPLKDGEVHPVYKAMNLLNYDGATVGNHEFNYGLDFLKIALKGANFPYVTSNVYIDDKDNDPTNDVNYFTPYTILDRSFTDENGQVQKLKVGVIGFVTPQIMLWDRAHLQGKIITKDIIESAKKYVPQMKKEGADIIVALSHAGIDGSGYTPGMENASFYLSEIEGIDAILTGHQHKTFPGKDYAGIKGIDNEKGTINGVATLMPGSWGNNIGYIDLKLEKKDGKWSVVDSQSVLKPLVDADKKPTVESDQAIIDAVKAEHEGTLEYVRGPVGETTAPITSYFALVQDDPSIQIVTNAQKWYVENALKGTEYEGIPVLSAGAPFKAGGRGGPNYYTDIQTGTIAIKNVADLYLYPNTVYALLLSGKEVREWLEWSAGQFNQIDPKSKEEQALINLDFPTYNFDVIDGVTYQIDVTQPAKYDKSGKVIDEKAKRIKELKFNGKPVTDDMKFVVATNNYRASTSQIANPGGKNTIFEAPDENRQAIINYIQELKVINPTADNNWSLAPINENVKITFETGPASEKYAKGLTHLTFEGLLDSGFAKYTLDLKAKKEEPKKEEPKKQEPKKQEPKKETKKTELIYVVKKGDVLWKIAKAHNVSLDVLIKYNNLKNPDKIYPGQKIKIPQ